MFAVRRNNEFLFLVRPAGADRMHTKLIVNGIVENQSQEVALPPESEGFIRSFGVPVVAPSGQGGHSWALRFLRFAGLCR